MGRRLAESPVFSVNHPTGKSARLSGLHVGRSNFEVVSRTARTVRFLRVSVLKLLPTPKIRDRESVRGEHGL